MCLSGVLLGITVTSIAPSQVTDRQPLQVFDLFATIKRDLGVSGTKIQGLTQSGEGWAVIANASTANSVIIMGDLISAHAVRVSGYIDALQMDPSGTVYLRKRTPLPTGKVRPRLDTAISILDGTGAPREESILRLPNASPVLSGGRVMWRTRNGTFDTDTLVVNTPTAAALPDPNVGVANQAVYYFGLPNSQHLSFGDMTESVTLFDPDSSGSTVIPVHLDDAYKRFGVILKRKLPDRSTGESRTLWAAVGQDARLYICLTGTPFPGAAYIAAFDPFSGNVVETLRAHLPVTPGDRPSSPNHATFPHFGAVGNHLVIADANLGMLSIY